MKTSTIALQILFVLIALALVVESALAAELVSNQETELKPTASMPMWFYSVERQFKFPIPCDFEFAYIDSSGEVKITGPFLKAYPFKDGLAKVELGSYKLESGTWKLDPGHMLLRVLIDKNGKVVRRKKSGFESDDIKTKVVNGKKVLVMPETGEKEKRKSKHLDAGTIPQKLKRFENRYKAKWGYEDEEGNEYIAAKYDFAYPFSEGFARVVKRSFAKTINPLMNEMKSLREASKASDKETKEAAQKKLKMLWDKYKKSIRHTDLIGYLNKKGDTIVPLEKYFEGRDFSDGLAAVYRDDKWGYIDSTGKEVVEPLFDKAGDFGAGLAPILSNNKFGYINKTGKIEIPCKFAIAGKFVGGLAPATLDGINWGYINKTGQFAISPKFKRTFEFSDGLALVMIPLRKDIDKNKKEAVNFYLSSVYFASYNKNIAAEKALKVAKALDNTKSSSKVTDMYLERVKAINEILKKSGYSIEAKTNPTKNQ